MSKSGLSNVVEGLSDVESTGKLFADKHRDLHTCVSYNTGEMKSLINDMREWIRDDFSSADCTFSVSKIETTVEELKPHKGDGVSGVLSDLFLNACDVLLLYIKMLFSAIIVHGFCPEVFCWLL